MATTTRTGNRTVTLALAALCLGSVVSFLRAQTPAPRPAASSKVLIQATLGGKAGETADPAMKTLLQERAPVSSREGRLSILTLEPGWWGAGFQAGGAHQHPGPIFAYILTGAVESQVDPDPARIYRAGDVFYEPQMHAHRLFRNASQTEPAELLMFQIFDKDAPTAMSVK